ncbi:hydrogenase expression/formation protein HypE [candidate division KSB1 bacterium]|nr:MAG: hydrogenase expression/formation protein HypE [candidate division KSB1 bacterium]MBC6951936.1 hydrogenase expression/formation protein HypE [candidate division KSB1 bacterium]MCE7940794.1 hydrogenase expression/formation protein HypE [Chlorobi bacterium CHB1]MDL1874180.1 hydrogenase expression/formation protein HypE [Cytophagia bacterium CHB2]
MQQKVNVEFGLSCPIPIHDYPSVLLAHGGGGRLMHQLIEKMFVPAFNNTLLESRHDGAVFNLEGRKLAFTTDSFVVHPLFFPGGDIGTLSIYGTVNDLAMCGAQPLYLSAGFILEEGLPMETLWRVVQSLQRAATHANVQLVTGDTKVVDRGKGDGIFINTAGIGVITHDLVISPASVKPGDLVLVNGDLGRHGIAIMAMREGLAFESEIESDCAPLADLVQTLLAANIEIHCLRDLTRGGLASALNEIAETARVQINLEEKNIPVREDVQGACEILGLDPLYIANEGRFIAFVPPAEVERALRVMRAHPLGEGARIIGEVKKESSGLVTMTSVIGANRIVDVLSGEQLPRIC